VVVLYPGLSYIRVYMVLGGSFVKLKMEGQLQDTVPILVFSRPYIV